MEGSTRDAIIDYVRYWSEKTDIQKLRFILWLGITTSKFFNWQQRYGKVNGHNGLIPRGFWLKDTEKEAITEFYCTHPGEGYRRVAYMMLDADIVAVSPSSVYRVLKKTGLMRKWNRKPSKKGTGFIQPLEPHEHWHVDVSYINIRGTFYYLCALLDGNSRFIVHWEIRESMTEGDIEIIMERAQERFPNQSPRIISDNGPQFISKDFKEYIRISGMSHVRTSPYYPQSNGKIERWHKSIKSECIRPKSPLSLEEARVYVSEYVEYYNNSRLHSAIGYISPKNKLDGKENIIFEARNRKLKKAREDRRLRRDTTKPITLEMTP